MQIWSNWLKTSAKKDSGQFLTQYSVNILPADSTLIAPLLLHARQFIETSNVSNDIQNALMGPGHILLSLVVIRSYLHRGPADDDLIWSLWTQGRLRRNWLPAEQAFAGLQGFSQVDLDQFGQLPKTNLSIEQIIKFDTNESVPKDFTIISVDTADGAPFLWPASNAAGMSGGSMEVVNSSGTDVSRQPRPVPRRKRVHDDGVVDGAGQADLDNDGPRRSQRLKRDSNTA